jgi:L-threonylcarbamoyladenylate synthase
MTGPAVVRPAERAAVLAALAAGAVVGLPTDTVYGLGARLDRPEALAAVFEAKGRPPGLALPVLVSDEAQARSVAADWPPLAARLAGGLWPGALTLVVPVDPARGRRLGGDGRTVGLRCPDHRLVRSLCAEAGPLAVTSANPHGAPPATTAEAVRAAFASSAAVAVVLDGGTCDGVPSTVVDATGPEPVCLRPGGLAWADVERVAGSGVEGG